MSEAGKIGGKARMDALTEEERSNLARKAGLKGGRARTKSLTPERRKEIAQKAIAARWAKKKG